MKVKQGENGGHGLLLWSAAVLLLMGCVFRISHQGSGVLVEAGKLIGAVVLALGFLAGEMYAVRLPGKWRYGIVAGLFCLGVILGIVLEALPGWYVMLYSVSVGLVMGENRNSGWLGVVKSLLPAIALPLLGFLLKASGMFLLYLWIPVGLAVFGCCAAGWYSRRRVLDVCVCLGLLIAAAGVYVGYLYVSGQLPMWLDVLYGYLHPQLNPLGKGFPQLAAMDALNSMSFWGCSTAISPAARSFLTQVGSHWELAALAARVGVIGVVAVIALYAVFLVDGLRSSRWIFRIGSVAFTLLAVQIVFYILQNAGVVLLFYVPNLPFFSDNVILNGIGLYVAALGFLRPESFQEFLKKERQKQGIREAEQPETGEKQEDENFQWAEPEDFRFRIKGSVATLVKYTGTAPEVSIPKTYQGRPVIAIGKKAFCGTPVRHVYFPETLETIDDQAFADCRELFGICTWYGQWERDGEDRNAEDGFGPGLKRIGKKAFYSTGIGGVFTKGDGLTLGKSAFENCSQLQVFIHSGKEALTVEPRVFAGSSLEYVVCETEAGISLPREAFLNCINLRALAMNISSLGDRCFFGCRSLETVASDVPLEKMGKDVFAHAGDLRNADLPESWKVEKTV